MYPFHLFCGTVSRPGAPVEPSSSFGASSLMINPLVLPSVPGQGRIPAPLFHSAEQTFDAKSYPVPIGESPATSISTQIGFDASAPIPKNCPLALLKIQKPRYFPAADGATI